MAKLTNAERNRKKRERKKRQKEEQRKQQQDDETNNNANTIKREEEVEVEIEYVPEEPMIPTTVNSTTESEEEKDDSKSKSKKGDDDDDDDDDDGNDMSAILRKFHQRSSTSLSSAPLVSEDESSSNNPTKTIDNENHKPIQSDDDSNYSSDEESKPTISKRKRRELSRPTVAELKTRVDRADLVEAHDVTSPDPDFLLMLKSVSGSVPVPRHWGRKRKYLQGKRGIEKAPFKLPEFIAKTGITDVRNSTASDEASQSAKQKNRSRVAPKMGGIDIDYRTLHDAFFKHQNRESIRVHLTSIGDLYYEGKEFETLHGYDGNGGTSDVKKIGGPLSDTLRTALGMSTAAENSTAPPPWLVNMQRYGPPPSYPNLKIPGLNAPLPDVGCSYGYHLNGWGKPPVDAYGRPMYGGNPFDPPGSSGITSTADWDFDAGSGAIVTSDGMTIGRKPWGALPMAAIDLDEEEEEDSSSSEEEDDSDEEGSSSGEEMAESDEEGEEKEDTTEKTKEESTDAGSALDLRKDAGTDTPAPPKQLYTVLQQTAADKEKQAGAVFTSDVAYKVPGAGGENAIPEGAESVLSKAVGTDPSSKRKRKDGDANQEDEGDLGKKFKF